MKQERKAQKNTPIPDTSNASLQLWSNRKPSKFDPNIPPILPHIQQRLEIVDLKRQRKV
jgi:hypothetical protein